MNTPVSFEIKQLLYDKGWRYELGVDETGYRVEHSLAEQRWNEGDLTYVDITITEIVMWLYEKHGIWISVSSDKALNWESLFSIKIDWIYPKDSPDSEDIEPKYFKYKGKNEFNSPTEAYEAAIEYTLTKLI